MLYTFTGKRLRSTPGIDRTTKSTEPGTLGRQCILYTDETLVVSIFQVTLTFSGRPTLWYSVCLSLSFTPLCPLSLSLWFLIVCCTSVFWENLPLEVRGRDSVARSLYWVGRFEKGLRTGCLTTVLHLPMKFGVSEPYQTMYHY